jgi:murein DD-endopeptidase MepM/ murein hydrolase activator NlpD
LTSGRRGIVASGCALALLLALAATETKARSDAHRVEAWVRRQVPQHLEKLHLAPDLVDIDAIATRARRHVEEKGSSSGIEHWLSEEVARAEWAFAPLDATPDPAARYGLPFDPVFPRLVTQGVGGRYSHTGREYYAFDFSMAVGTPVHAAREGVVARVVDGFTEGGPDEKLGRFANTILVLHGDGTVAVYTHLAPGGMRVAEGDRVSRGQPLAASGQTGFAGAPHLHFTVIRNTIDGPLSIPIRFGRPGSAGYVPVQDRRVGASAKPTLDLEIRADNEPVRPGTLRPVRPGDRVRLRVEARPRRGAARDVTNHPHLHLISLTPWNLDVVGAGEVELRAAGDPSIQGGDGAMAGVGVYFLNRERGEVGVGNVYFQVVDSGEPTP